MAENKHAAITLRERFKGLHWGVKALAVALAVFVLYTALGFWAAPPLIKSKLVSGLGQALGRAVSVEDVSLNPLSLRLEVRGVRIADLEDDAPLAGFEALELDLEYFSLIEWAVVIGEARLVKPHLRVVYFEGGGSNISDLMASEGEPPADRERSGIFPAVVKSFAIQGGNVVFEDQALAKTHRVENLDLLLPFVSTLPEDTAEPMVPRLDAKVNGTPVSLAGRVLPFAEPLRAEFDFSIQGSDLTHYWGYAPLPKQVGLAKGGLSCDAALVFERRQGVLPKLYVRGDFRLSDVTVTGEGGREVLRFEELNLKLRDLGIFDRVINAESLEITAPYAALTRTADGGLDWAGYLPLAGQEPDGETMPDMGADPADQGEQADTPALRLTADLLRVTGGRFDFTDNAVPGGFAMSLAPIEITARDVDTTDEAPAKLTATLGEESSGLVNVSADFGLFPFQAQGRLELSGVRPVDFAAYYRQYLPLEVRSGVLSAGVDVVVPPGEAARARVQQGSMELADLALAAPGSDTPQIRVQSLTVQEAGVDPAARSIGIGDVLVLGADISVTRAGNGSVDLVEVFGEANKEQGREPEPQARQGPAWTVTLDALEASEAVVTFTDNAAPRPGSIELVDVSARLEKVRLEEGREMPLTLSAGLGAGGQVDFEGMLTLPSRVDGELSVDSLSLSPVNMYLPGESSMTVASGAFNAEGRFAAGGEPVFSFTGRAGLAGLAVDEQGGDGLLSLDGLDLEGLQVQGLPLVVRMNQAALRGTEVRYAVEEDGGTNLGRAMAGFGGGEQPDKARAGEQDPVDEVAVGRVSLEGGRLDYEDKRVTPAFASFLSEIGGEITGLSLADGEPSQVSINALINGSAPFSAEGSLNIAQATAATDLALRVKNLDLPPLTPYSVKYIAYPLTRGKLHADVDMSIRDLELEADNVIRIERMEIGDKVESETAADVPMELAMSLLTDGSGTMVLEVPVSGRLDDPEFSLGRVIFKAIGSLLGKIVTAPFAFIGAIFGGSDAPENVGVLEFAAGSSELDATDKEKLAAVSRALADRPRLRLEIAGFVDPDADARALADARIEELLYPEAQKEADGQAQQDLPPDKQLELLRGVFEEVTGLDSGDRPQNELYEIMRESLAVGDDGLRALATARSAAARDYLVQSEGVDPGRIFMVERGMKTAPEQEDVARARVDLGLAG